jgi:drug/metabolite transporter (DMT)-like permease
LRLSDYLMLGYLGLAWGSSFLFVAIGFHSFGPTTMAALRIAFGGALVIAWALMRGYRPPKRAAMWLYFLAMGLTGHVIPFSLIIFGQTRIASSTAAILVSAVPLFTLLLAHLFTDDRITPAKAVGVLIGFAGVVLLVGPEALGGLSGRFWGQVMVVGGALSYAVSIVLARRMGGVSPVMSAAGSLFVSTLIMVPLALALETPWRATFHLEAVLAALAIGIVSTGIAMLVFFRLIISAGPNFVAANNYIVPGVALIWGVVLLGEPLTWRAVAALGVILIGVTVATVRRPAPRPAAETSS